VAFLRAKSVKDRVYLYLVENRWDATAGYPRQRVLRYLGPLEHVRPEDLPAPHRTPKLERSLADLQASLRTRRAPAEAAFAESLLAALLAGDREAARKAARSVSRAGGLDRFYGRTLPEVFHRIGEGWQAGRISIAREHVATRVAAGVVEELNAALPEAAPGAPEAVLCVPDGETHTIPLLLAEGLLRRSGFRTVNLGGMAPTPEIVGYVVGRRPTMVLISVTEPSRLGAARTLAARTKAAYPDGRVILGGQAVAAFTGPPGRDGAEIVRSSLDEFLKTGGLPVEAPSAVQKPRRPAAPGRRAGRARST